MNNLQYFRNKMAESGFELNLIEAEKSMQAGQASEENYDRIYHLRELLKRSFTRRLNLPQNIGDPEEARLKDGVLTLIWNLPKKEEPERRFIEVKQE